MSARPGLSALAVVFALAGCNQVLEAPTDDGLSARSQCESQAILDLLNDPATTEASLKADGLYSRAASSLMDTRDGADDVYDTEDDVTFTSLEQVDAVPQVGPTSMDTLLSWGAEGCTTAGSCVPDAMLDLVNDVTTTGDDLKDLGVYARGADMLVALRPFDTVDAIDDTPYVGPSSMDALYSWANAACAEPDIEVIFSPQSYDDSHLSRVVELIDDAERSIDIAMYSFSEHGVKDAVERAAARGVSIRLISEKAKDHEDDPAGTWSADFEDMGIETVWINKVMHHKYAIIDGPRTSLDEADDAILLTGSGNWSYSAGTRYDENTMFFYGDPKLVLAFQQEFELLWDHSRPVIWNESIPPIDGLDITDADIAAAEGSEAVFTTDNMRIYESATYGWTFSKDGDKWTGANAFIEQIEQADESIWLASGHLRSTPIAMALLDKAATEPWVDIRVYLDGQEYTSWWTWNEDASDYYDCMDDAVDEGDLMDCAEMGVYWGYSLQDAGIDLRYKHYAYRWDYTYAEQMHHKYMVVDGDTVLSGSYNLSPNGEFDTIENIAILEDSRYPDAVDAFVANHAEMWETGRDEGLYDELLDEILYGTSGFSIVFDSMALTWDEVDVLKDAIRDACPEVDSEAWRTDAAGHTWCDR